MTESERYAIIAVLEERFKSVFHRLDGIDTHLKELNGNVAENAKRSTVNVVRIEALEKCREEQEAQVVIKGNRRSHLMTAIIAACSGVGISFLVQYAIRCWG